MDVVKELESSKLLPIITLHSEEAIDIIGEVILKSDIKLVEVAYRSGLAAKAIKKYSQFDGKIVGAGTVRNIYQAKEAIANGAQFLVSPGIDIDVLEYAKRVEIPIFPGVLTPSEMLFCMNRYNIDTFKLFPANLVQGLEGIRSLKGPFFDVKFLPTGGINKNNYLEYLSEEQIIAVGGSFIINDKIEKSQIDLEVQKINSLICNI